MRIVPAVLAAALPLAGFAQQAPKPQGPAPLGIEEGFFKPAPDPALTAVRPAPRPAQTGSDRRTSADGEEMARPVRAAEEAQLQRAAREHEAAHAVGNEISRRLPPVGSPLDGTAPIVSPLDGSAPILSPLGR